MKRALAALTAAAYLTLVVDVAGEHSSALSLLPGTAFLAAATIGFAWTQRWAARWLAYAHIAVLLSLRTAVFALSYASVGATLLLVVLVSQTVLPLPAVVVLVTLLHAGMSLAEGLVARFVQLPTDGEAVARPPAVALSARELAVARLLAAGHSNREIARSLFLAEGQ